MNYEQRQALVRQVARRLEKLDDSLLAELESHTRPGKAAAAALAAENDEAAPGLSRRNFLRDVLIYTGAGLALGGGAAVAADQWRSGTPGASAPLDEAAGVVVQGLQGQVDESAAQVTMLQQSLAVAESALQDARLELSTALTENANLKNDLTASHSTLLQTQQTADGLRGQLGEAQAKLEQYRGLIALFDSLDAIPLDSAIVSGLASAAVSFGSVLGLAPLVAQGLAAARSLFTDLENQFPALRAGLDWLKERLDGLENGVATVEAAAENAVDRLDPAANRLAQLIDYILGHLPFGIGRSIKGALEAVNDVYHSLPDLILGTRGQVVNVLGEKLGEGKAGLSKTVLQPVRETAFAPAEQLVAQVETLHQTYVRDLHDPLVGALDRRNAVRQDIAAYRAANGL